ncbi:MAG: SWIM zinc finger family protein [Saprospiraceae bacterium]
MNRLTETQVAQLAPDAATLQSGKKLANAVMWQTAEFNHRALWGEIKGSGAAPYQTQIDLTALAYKCTCPSRKFPCKHCIGLLLLFAQQASAVHESAHEPAWVSAWVDKRAAATASTDVPQLAVTDEKKEQAKAKRNRERQSAMLAGADELDLWLRDLIRTGLLSLPDKDDAFFSKVVRRMVDAKATGLAALVRKFSKINYVSDNKWHSAALENAAKTWLLIQAFRRLETLKQPEQGQIKALIGWGQGKKELLEDPNATLIDDHWLALAIHQETLDDKLVAVRTWLVGAQTGQNALLVDYFPAHLPVVHPVKAGNFLEAQLAFYPSNYPLRAQIKHQQDVKSSFTIQTQALPGWAAAQQTIADCLAQSPWADDIPLFVANLLLATDQHTWFLRDQAEAIMPIAPACSQETIYQLLSVYGGSPMSLFVLRQGTCVLPLGYWTADKSYTPL